MQYRQIQHKRFRVEISTCSCHRERPHLCRGIRSRSAIRTRPRNGRLTLFPCLSMGPARSDRSADSGAGWFGSKDDMRLRARVDQNQKSIVDSLRKCGVLVMHLHQLGHGKPDIVACHNGRCFLFEIKNPDQCKSARSLTPDEETFHQQWEGYVWTVETFEQIAKIMEIRCR